MAGAWLYSVAGGADRRLCAEIYPDAKQGVRFVRRPQGADLDAGPPGPGNFSGDRDGDHHPGGHTGYGLGQLPR